MRNCPCSAYFVHHRSAGFTLLELMITVVVLGILSVIAYASYADQILKAQRSVAKSALLDAATRQERYFFSNRAYATTMTALGFSASTSPDAYYGKDGSPLSSTTDAIYKVSVNTLSCGTAPCFTLIADPVDGSFQEGDSCGSFTLSSTNARSAAKSGCW